MSLLLLLGQERQARVSWVQLEVPAAAPAVNLPAGAQYFDLPPCSYARVAESQSYFNPNLQAPPVVPVGAQLTDRPVPLQAQRLPDYSITAPLLPLLQSQPDGHQWYPLPVPATGRLADYTQIAGPLPELIGQDRVYDGPGQVPAYDWQLPNRGPARAVDYSFVWDNTLTEPANVKPVGSAWTDLPYPPAQPRLRDYTVVLQLLPLLQSNPDGKQYSELPYPPAALRLRDYTWLHDTDSQLIGQDVIYDGAGHVPTYDWQLTPRAAPRAVDYSFNFYNPLTQPPAIKPVGQDWTDLPYPPAPLRLRDYTWLHNTDDQLIGRDTVYGSQGEAPAYDWQLPSRGYARAVDYSFTFYNPLTQPPAIKPVGQTWDALPPRAYDRARDYTWLQSPRLNVGQDVIYGTFGQAPAYDLELPPHGPARMADYSWSSFNIELYTPPAAVPPGDQWLDLPPRAYAKLSDYTWTQSGNSLFSPIPPPGKSSDALPPRGAPRAQDYTWLHVLDFTTLPLPPGQQVTEGPPKGPLRLRDYSVLHRNTEYINHDQFYGTDGEVITYDWQLPPRPYARARDYTWQANTVRYIGQDRIYNGPGQVPAYDWQLPIPYRRPVNNRDPWSPFVLFTGPAPVPGTVLGGSSITDTVLAGTSAMGSVTGGTSFVGSALGGPSQNEL